MFLDQKIRYVQNLFEEWKLTAAEQCRLFGVDKPDDLSWTVLAKSSASEDFEARCDLIYRIKLTLVQANGKIDLEQEADWFRTRLRPLGNLSPLEFLKVGHRNHLAEFVLRLEGPTLPRLNASGSGEYPAHKVT